MHTFVVIKLAIAVAITTSLAACGGNPNVEKLRGSAFDAELEQVWYEVVKALAVDYPVMQQVDFDKRRIVTCWRPIQRDANAKIAGAPGSGWRLFRVSVEISDTRPYRITVSGRSANYEPPQINPIERGDLDEPGWVEGRIDRATSQIYERLASVAVPAPAGSVAPREYSPRNAQNYADTCVVRAAEFGIPWRGMEGIAVGEPGASPSGQTVAH